MGRHNRMLSVLWKKFNEFRKQQIVIKFDNISEILKTFFMEELNEKNIKTNENKWIISFDKIVFVYPNAKELIFLNEYEFDDRVSKRLRKQIEKKDNKLIKISFSNFKGDSFTEALSSYQSAVYGNDQKLADLPYCDGWKIKKGSVQNMEHKIIVYRKN